jgi:hypothetical protein
MNKVFNNGIRYLIMDKILGGGVNEGKVVKEE